jgi:alkylation response protein AidB-like acyl-CoA dehydrogenase
MLCLQAEEVGRALAPIPFTTSACGYAAGLGLACDAVAKADLLPMAAAGSAIGVLLTEDCWRHGPRLLQSSQATALIEGVAGNVPDGAAATVAIALVGKGAEATIVHIDLSSTARSVATDCLDLLHPCASFNFERTPARVLTRGEEAEAVWQRIEDRYALFTAFEQIGAAAAALEMAREYALQRYAFGRPIASFQALKHTFADLFAALDLARSNCLYGAAALQSAPEQLHEAAAVARISATEAFRRCARGNMQAHGALGVTWDSGCHLYYRRAQALAGHPGAVDDWKDRLVQSLLERSCDSGVAA